MPMSPLKIGEFIFEWDRDKSTENKRKHGIAFQIAATLWSHPEKVLDIADARFSYGEDRWIALGPLPADERTVLAVAYCDRGEAVRILSARYAERAEEIAYRRRMEGRIHDKKN